MIVCAINKRPKKIKTSKEIIATSTDVKMEKVMDQYKLNYVKDPDDERDYKLQTLLAESSTTTLPSSVDHSSMLSPVKDQGSLGSCVGFAVTALKEWQEKQEHEEEVAAGKKDFRGGKEYDLSESWVYWNSKKIDPWPNEEGTSIRYAMKVLNRIGVPTEKAWPYDDTNIGEPKKWASMVARWACIGSYWRIDNLQELKAALQVAPVPIGIACFREIFYVGTDGIIPDPSNEN